MPIPAYYAVGNFEEFKAAVEALRGECIVKPADNAGSRGVVLLDGKKDQSEEELLHTYEYSKSNSRNGTVMVEEFMTGAEVSVEAMTVNGETTIITITDKFITPPPYFVEIAHSEPCRLPEEIQQQIRDVALQAVKAIGLQNGPSHTEIKVTPQGPKIVELAARLGGDFITSKLVPLSTGVDMVAASVLLATGAEVDLEPKWKKGSAIHFIQGMEGRIKSITVEEEVYQLKGVEEVSIYKQPGDEVHGTKSSNDRLGHILTVGQTAEEAMKIGDKALSMVHVEYEGMAHI